MKYDYYKAVRYDVRNYIKENIDYYKENYEYLSEAEDKLNDELWAEDSVTGNGSGSYTFNSGVAKDYLEDNFDLGIEAYSDFGYDKSKFYEDFVENPEKADVTIRCYCLPTAIYNICSEYELEDFENDLEM